MNAILTLILRGIMLLLAYLFVGWICITIFRDLRNRTTGKSNLSAPRITIIGQEEWESISKEFQKPEIIIGRDPDSDISIPNETISLKHCKIFFHHKQWWANDLDSTNGSFINDNPIDSPVIITNGDVLRLGNVTLSININPLINRR